jgi:hypothetical protein
VCEITWFVAAVLAFIASVFSEKSIIVVIFCFLSFINVSVSVHVTMALPLQLQQLLLRTRGRKWGVHLFTTRT